MSDKNSASAILAHENLAETPWGCRIIKAESSGLFTYADLRASVFSDQSGPCSRYPIKYRENKNKKGKYTGRAPEDAVLRELDLTFFDQVCKNQIPEAAATLVKIDARATRIIAKDSKERLPCR